MIDRLRAREGERERRGLRVIDRLRAREGEREAGTESDRQT